MEAIGGSRLSAAMSDEKIGQQSSDGKRAARGLQEANFLRRVSFESVLVRFGNWI